MSKIEDLRELKKLLDEGLITEDDYNRKKTEILDFKENIEKEKIAVDKNVTIPPEIPKEEKEEVLPKIPQEEIKIERPITDRNTNFKLDSKKLIIIFVVIALVIGGVIVTRFVAPKNDNNKNESIAEVEETIPENAVSYKNISRTDSKAKKGDIIEIENEEYRVLDYADGKAKVVSMTNVASTNFRGSNMVSDEKGNSLLSYENSTVDEKMTDFYNSLSSDMQNAIEESEINLYSYTYEDEQPKSYAYSCSVTTSQYYAAKQSNLGTIERKVYALDFSDIGEYLGKKDFSSDDIAGIFYTENWGKDEYIWLRSVFADSAFVMNDSTSTYYANTVVSKEGYIFIRFSFKEYEDYIRPAFTINVYLDGSKSSTKENNQIAEIQSKEFNVGDTFTLGTYDNQDIEWFVLDKNEDSILVISKYILENEKYNDVDKSIRWEDCTLRDWLNNDFINDAFDQSTKDSIILTIVENSDNSSYGTSGGNSTEDKIFLLSIDEAKNYFHLDSDRSANKIGEKSENCWLRSPGSCTDYAALVDEFGGINEKGYMVNYKYGVRSVMWISLK